MSIGDWIFTVAAIFLMFGWPLLFLRPSWLILRRTWRYKKTAPTFFGLGAAHAIVVCLAMVYLFWGIFFGPGSEEFGESPGFVLALSWLSVPLCTLPVSLGFYYLIRHFAKKHGAWYVSHS